MSNRHFSNRYDGPKYRNRRKRPKSFKSEESAKKWADNLGLKNYDLVNMRLSGKPKIKIVLK